jgi:hypothetical protein
LVFFLVLIAIACYDQCVPIHPQIE